jgi:hypothetical protein
VDPRLSAVDLTDSGIRQQQQRSVRYIQALTEIRFFVLQAGPREGTIEINYTL